MSQQNMEHAANGDELKTKEEWAKTPFLEPYIDEIAHLRRQLEAAREKKVVTLELADYNDMVATISAHKEEIKVRNVREESLEETLAKRNEEIQVLNAKLIKAEAELDICKYLIKDKDAKLKKNQDELERVKLEAVKEKQIL